VTGFFCGDEGTFELVLRTEPFTGDSNDATACADDDTWQNEYGDQCSNLWLYDGPWLYNCERLADSGLTEEFIQLYMYYCPQSCGLCDYGGYTEVEEVVPLDVDVEVPSYDWPASLSYEGNTVGLANHRGYPTGDFVVLLHAVDTGTWTFSTCSEYTQFDTVVRVYMYVNSSVVGLMEDDHPAGVGIGALDHDEDDADSSDGFFNADDDYYYFADVGDYYGGAADGHIATNDDDSECPYSVTSSTVQAVLHG
jgi:hypothetical protein